MNKLFYLLLTLTIIFSCGDSDSDPCALIDCKNGSICISGTCECSFGSEGIDCTIETRAKFYGIWVGNNSCRNTDSSDPGTDQLMTIKIEAGEDILSLAITNLSTGQTSIATLDSKVEDGTEYDINVENILNAVSSFGELKDEILRVLAITTENGISTTCVAELIKQ